jgi:hypothetical protein
MRGRFTGGPYNLVRRHQAPEVKRKRPIGGGRKKTKCCPNIYEKCCNILKIDDKK